MNIEQTMMAVRHAVAQALSCDRREARINIVLRITLKCYTYLYRDQDDGRVSWHSTSEDWA